MSEPFHPNHLIPGTSYRYVRTLGQGGQGIVVLAADDFLQTEVVIKLVHASHSQYLSTRIRDEARTLAKIKHPSVVRVIGGGMTDEPTPRPYFAMERLDGDTLYAMMRRRGRPFSMRSAIDIAIELLEGLDVAHNPPHSLLHRDIKPANIFMCRISPHETRAVLLDFGLAHMFAEASRITGKHFLGTLEYASPEQLLGKPLTPRSDLYNIGLVLFELLSGRHLFGYCKGDRNAYAHAHLHDEPARLSALGIDMDPALDEIVYRAVHKDPNARPRSAHDFAHALKAIRTSLDIARPFPVHDAATEEEPFEQLWAHMGVTPTTSGASDGPSSPLWGGGSPSSRSTVSAPAPGKSVEQPLCETREEPARKLAFASAPAPKPVTAPTPTEELPGAREYKAAMRKFRAADTEPSAPPAFADKDVSSPPIVLDRARRLVRRMPASALGISFGVSLALAVVFAVARYNACGREPSRTSTQVPTAALLAPIASVAASSETRTELAPPPPIASQASAATTASPSTMQAPSRVAAVSSTKNASATPTEVKTTAGSISTLMRAPPAPSVSPSPSASAPPPPGMDLLKFVEPSLDPPASTKPKRPGSGLDAPPAATKDKATGLFTRP